MTLGLIVIDMDDTVYLERDYVRSGFLAVDQYVRDHGAPPGFFEFAWRMFCDGATGDIFDRAIEAMSLPDVVAVGNLVDCYRQHVPDIMMTDDSTGFLKSIDGRVPVALITDGPAVSQRNKITALGLDAYLDEIVVTEERGSSWHKPSSRGFAHLQEHFSVEPSQCIYLADNPAKDFQAPDALGWRTLRIRRPGGLHFQQESTIEESATLPERAWIDERI